MLRNKPSLPYCGLTIVLSNPSRADVSKLLSAKGGEVMNNHCLRPDLNVMMCDVRLADDPSPWLEGTRCILLCGTHAMHKYLPETKENTLNEMRGSPFTINNIPTYATYFPQDAADFKNHEAVYNEQSYDYVGGDEDSKESDEEGDVKRFSNTKRANYSFWLRRDVWKCKQVLLGKRFASYPKPIYHIIPTSDEVINTLSHTKGQSMDFDIETDYEKQNLLCFSFTFDGTNIYCVPVLDSNYCWAYSSLHLIMRALCVAVRDNTLVAHNGAGFDFHVLGYKYHIPVKKCWDTLMAMHRCFPAVEKSLGHCTSYWLNEVFHKDSDSRAYFTHDHMMQKLKYCGKDVFTMSCIRKEIQSYAKTIPGLEYSIDVAMRSIRPYITCSMQGIKYDEAKRAAKVKENDRLMVQYMRMIRLLMGEQCVDDVRRCVKGGGGKAFPNSNKQCCEYFHNIMGYKVVWRNPPDKKGVRNPSLAKRQMLKLRLLYENPIIDLVNAYRYTRLEGTTPMGFTPWKDDDNKIIDVDEYEKQHALQVS